MDWWSVVINHIRCGIIIASSAGGVEGASLHEKTNPALIPPEFHAGAAEIATRLSATPL
jgi:hypothetical protein